MKYAKWICIDCAKKHNGKIKINHFLTCHKDVCDMCNKLCSVTQPNNFDILGLKSNYNIDKALNNLKFEYILKIKDNDYHESGLILMLVGEKVMEEILKIKDNDHHESGLILIWVGEKVMQEILKNEKFIN